MSRDIEETKKRVRVEKRGSREYLLWRACSFADYKLDLNGGIVALLGRVKYCFNGDLTHLCQVKLKYILMDNFNLQDIANSVFLPTADVSTSVFLLTASVLTYLSDKR